MGYIRDELSNLHGKMTIIITHKDSTIQHADFLVLIEEGRIKASGIWSKINQTDYNKAFEIPLIKE